MYQHGDVPSQAQGFSVIFAESTSAVFCCCYYLFGLILICQRNIIKGLAQDSWPSMALPVARRFWMKNFTFPPGQHLQSRAETGIEGFCRLLERGLLSAWTQNVVGMRVCVCVSVGDPEAVKRARVGNTSTLWFRNGPTCRGIKSRRRAQLVGGPWKHGNSSVPGSRPRASIPTVALLSLLLS